MDDEKLAALLDQHSDYVYLSPGKGPVGGETVLLYARREFRGKVIVATATRAYLISKDEFAHLLKERATAAGQ